MKYTYTKKDGMYVFADEVMQDLQISKPLAYRFIREWNEELRKQDYVAISGRIPRAFYKQKVYGMTKE